MSYLNYQIKDLQLKGGFHTAKEISSQPGLWAETYSKLLKEKPRVLGFLQRFWNEQSPRVILTGAGTSAFIGETMEGPLQREWGIPCQAIETTDIVTHPENYFIKSKPTLLISFARSGDSPESLQAVRLAQEHCEKLYELNLTCNAEGSLAKNTNGEDSCLFLLPEKTNDQSLAMTSSFSSMLLAGLLIMNIRELAQMAPVVSKIGELGQYILDECLPGLKRIAEMDFERIVFLGSGPLFGVAHESHLKVQELSNGKIVGKFDSFLGFRHGPKAVVNNATVVVYLLSNDAHVNLYELDLIRSVKQTAAGEKSVAIGNYYNEQEFDFDLAIKFPQDTDDIPEEFLSLPYILPAQIIGFYKSLILGLSPDSPSTNSSISRVVQGVKIYTKNQSK